MMADKGGFSADIKQLEKLEAVADWVAPAAARLGLTQFAAPGDFAQNLMAPSFDLLPYLGNSIRSIAEVGPGNGGLGLSLAVLLPNHSVHLIDRRRKVCDFLALTAARFEITNCTVHEASVANYQAEPQSFDVVAARAVASSDVLLVDLPKIVSSDGLLALFKTEAPVLAPPGLQLVTHVTTHVPGLWLDLFKMTQQDV